MKQPDAAGSAGEVRYATFMANRVQDGRAFGGRVTITNQRITFVPVALSEANGGRSWEIGLTGAGSGRCPARSEGLPGSLRPTLRVRTHAGEAEYFVVWRPRRQAALINRVRARQ